MAPFFNKENQLYHMDDRGPEIKLKSLKGQYRNERQLYSLMSLIITLEKMGLM